MEEISIIPFISDFVKFHGETIRKFNTIEEARQLSRIDAKPVLLYLHNNSHRLSKKILPFLQEDIFHQEFHFVAWDVANEIQNEVLMGLASIHSKYDIVFKYIKDKIAAIFIFKLETYEHTLSGLFTEPINEDFFLNDIKSFVMDSHKTEEKENNIEALSQNTFEFNENIELNGEEITENNIEALSQNTFEFNENIELNGEEITENNIEALNQNTFEFNENIKSNGEEIKELMETCVQKTDQCNFEYGESLSSATAHALKNEIPLLVYIHKEGDIFSEFFSKILSNEDVNHIFNNFSMYKFDMSDVGNPELSPLGTEGREMYMFLRHEEDSGLFIYSTINEKIKLYKKIHGIIEDEANFLFELYNIYMQIMDDKKKHNETIEKLATVSFINYFEGIYGLAHIPFQIGSLDTILRKCMYVDFNSMGKVFVLYLHNSYHNFSMKLMHKLAHGPVRERLENFCFLPWDLKDDYLKVLKVAVRDHFDLERIEEMVENKIPGLFIFLVTNGKPFLYTHIGPEFNIDLLPDVLDGAGEYFSVTYNSTDFAELKCCREIENPILNSFRGNIPLQQIIPEHCLVKQLRDRRILLLYFYVENSTFTNNFLKWLKVSENATFIKKYFYLFTWDITKKELQQSLLLAIKRYFNLEEMETLLRNKISALFVFQPIAQTLNLVSVFTKNKTLDGLRNIQTSFAKEITIELNLPNNLNLAGPVPFQQLMYDRLGDRDYDCIELNKENHQLILNKKIGFAFYGPPTNETEFYSEIQNKKIELACTLVKSICSETNLNNEIMLSCIYTCTTLLPEEKLEKYKKDRNYDPHSDFNIYPVFILRKCVNSPNSNCRIIIDHDLRVYQSWADYLENNQLPKCICIMPHDGRYTGDIWGNVRVQFKLSPACGIDKAILKGIDIGSAIVGIGAGGIAVASTIPALAVLTAAAPVAAAVGFTVGGYSIVRSAITLYNRNRYRQSVNVLNSEARGAYFNILAGSLGFVGASSTLALSYFARNGAQIGMVARGAVNGITGMNVLVSGASLVNSSYDAINQWINNEPPNALTILQLSSSILFFGHSVYNIRSANSIINQAQYEGMQDVMSSLRSNRHRKTVAKMRNASIQEHGSVQKGTAEVISYVKNLENRDDVIATLTRSKKIFAENGVRYSVKNGQLNLNGIVVDINEFGTMSKRDQKISLMNLSENPPNFKVNTPKLVESYMNGLGELILKNVGTVIQSNSVKEAIFKMINIFSDYVQKQLLKILLQCLKYLSGDIDIFTSIQSLYPSVKYFEFVLTKIIDFFKSSSNYDPNYYCLFSKNDSNSSEEDNSKKYCNKIVFLVEKAIIISSLSVGRVVLEIVKYIKSEIIILICEKMDQKKEDETRSSSRTASAIAKQKVCCNICKGIYYC